MKAHPSKIEHILFIQGGGDGGYETDKKMVASLQSKLGPGFVIHYPEIKPDLDAPDYGWLGQIGAKIRHMPGHFILVAHSFGASMALKYLSEDSTSKVVNGVFLISTPLWGGNEDWAQGIKLREGFSRHLPETVPFFFYHAIDDGEVPFSHFESYRKKLPTAVFRKVEHGGHQINNDLSLVAKDIMNL